MIAELPPLEITSNFNVFQCLIVIPWYLGILCAPGFAGALNKMHPCRV